MFVASRRIKYIIPILNMIEYQMKMHQFMNNLGNSSQSKSVSPDKLKRPKCKELVPTSAFVSFPTRSPQLVVGLQPTLSAHIIQELQDCRAGVQDRVGDPSGLLLHTVTGSRLLDGAVKGHRSSHRRAPKNEKCSEVFLNLLACVAQSPTELTR